MSVEKFPTWDEALLEFKRRYIETAAQHANSVAALARIAGFNRTSIYRFPGIKKAIQTMLARDCKKRPNALSYLINRL